MATRGGQPGNDNATKNHLWRGALNRALAQYKADGVPQGEALNRIAERVVQQALKGDKDCIAEIANRLDGKAVQGLAVTQTEPLTIVHRVE
jgi:hypothetical protein